MTRALILLLALPTILAQATTSSLALVSAQWINSGFANTNNTGFGIALKPTALLNVVYGSTTVQNGAALTAAAVATLPTISVIPGPGFAASSTYTLLLADASSLGDPDPAGNYRHYLANGVTAGAPGANSSITLVSGSGTVVTSYAGPGPIAGTGPHRYAWMLFSQATAFAAPTALASTGVAPGHWNVSTYANVPTLTLIAASFFTVQNGTPTGSVAVTSAASTASASASAVTSGAASATTSSATTATSASATSAKSSGSKLEFGFLAAAIGALIFVV